MPSTLTLTTGGTVRVLGEPDWVSSQLAATLHSTSGSWPAFNRPDTTDPTTAGPAVVVNPALVVTVEPS